MITLLLLGGEKMYNPNELKGEIIRNGLTQEDCAKELGITPTAFNYKLNKGKFYLQEANSLIDLLHIKDPMFIFFGKETT